MPIKTAYILSLKHGLPAFTFREIKQLIHIGVDVHCYIVRSGKGPYMPEPSWNPTGIKKCDVIVNFCRFLFSGRKGIFATFASAVKDKGIIHFLLATYFTKYLERDSIDVIYCFEGLHALWIGYYCHLFTGIPLTVIVHAEMVDTKQKVALTKKALEKCYKIITISNYNKARIIRQFHVQDEQVEVVRLFANFEEDMRIRVLIVGEWSERKGHETLLRAIQEPGMEDFKVWIVGGGAWGSEYFDVEKYVNERNLEDRVVIWGKVSEDLLKLLYENCDIFCLPSRTTRKGVQEGIPVALMEAMFFTKPVISTYHTGIPELVPEILIHENDHKALAEALVKLRSPELREKLGVANREIIKKSYSVRNVEGIARILEKGIMGR